MCPPHRWLAGDSITAREPAFQAGSPNTAATEPLASHVTSLPPTQGEAPARRGRGHSSPRGRSRTGAHGSRATQLPDVTRLQCPKQRGTRFGVLLVGRQTQREDESLERSEQTRREHGTTRPGKMSRRACSPKLGVPEGESGSVTEDSDGSRSRTSSLGRGWRGPPRWALLARRREAAWGRCPREVTRPRHPPVCTVPWGSSWVLGWHRCCAHARAGVRMKLPRFVAKIHITLVS